MPSKDVEQLRKKLRAVSKHLRRNVSPAVDKSADEIISQAKSFAPVDDGTLRDSIRTRNKTDLGVDIVAGGSPTKRKTASGFEYDYAVGAEFGTQNSPAQPFFWPAYRLNRKRAIGRIRRAVAKSVKDAFK